MDYKNESLFFNERTRALVDKLTLEQKIRMLTTHHNPVEELGIKEFYVGTEVARGLVLRSPEKHATVFPEPFGLAATFDKPLMHALGEVAADETRAFKSVDPKLGLAMWGPTVDMVRDPRWGRTEEAYGEDVFLAGELTTGYTLGLYGDDEKYAKVIPTLKHFCANNNEEKRGSSNSVLPPRLKHEYYYAAFRPAITRGGARAVMSAYNSINGVPAIANPDLQRILKDKWGLWFVVSDGGDFSGNVLFHRFCETHAESLALSLKAGCDTMTDIEELVHAAAHSALEKGYITAEDIDTAVYNTLYARFRLGEFDSDCPFEKTPFSVVCSEKHTALNAKATDSQIVLLKNDGILPIRTAPRKIAVIGALADENLMDWYSGYPEYISTVKSAMAKEFPDSEIHYDSGWDYVGILAPNGKYLSVAPDGSVSATADEPGENEIFELQHWGANWNNLRFAKNKKYLRLNDNGKIALHNEYIYDWFTHESFGISEQNGKALLTELIGNKRLYCDEMGDLSFEIARGVKPANLFEIKIVDDGCGVNRSLKLASSCDLVVFCTGNHPVQAAKECIDRKTLEMNVQAELSAAIGSKCKNAVMVLISGYPYSICRENELYSAIIHTSHAGAELGNSVAKTLSGRNNPAGRTPITWYRSDDELPSITDYDIEKNGTTYMYFDGKPLYCFGHGLSYSEFVYSNLRVCKAEDGYLASLEVSNISMRDGDEVVQIYFRVKDSSISRPRLKLCGFERVHIGAGDACTVKISIPEYILEVYDPRSDEMYIECGEYEFFAAASSSDIRLGVTVGVGGRKQGVRNAAFEAASYESGSGFSTVYSRRQGRFYILADGWSAIASYGGITLSRGAKLRFTASCCFCPQTVLISVNGEKVGEIGLLPSDSIDDFSEYFLNLPFECENAELTVSSANRVALLDFRIVSE